jgi:O-antigen/teichoic acid export membrane protein
MRIILRQRINSVGKQLYFFSFPLVGVSALQIIITYTDTLMLGYFKTSDVVGFYNAACPIALIIEIPMGALLFIYAPIIAGLYAKKSTAEIGKIYSVITRWIFLATFPLFLIFFIFPETIISLFFGTNYLPASQALQVLSLGFIIVNLLGPNGTTLMTIGRTRFLLWASAAAAGMNIILNIALIPHWGMLGASMATAISLSVHCLIRHIKVQQVLKVNSITKNFTKSALISTGLILAISFLVRSFLDTTLWILSILFILFYAVYAVVSLFNKSFDEEDIIMLAAIENWVGVNFISIKKMLKKLL